MDIKSLIVEEGLHQKRLEELVRETIKEEELLSSRLMELDRDSEITPGQRLADRVAEFGGSWTFIIFFFAVLVAWVVVNLAVMNQQPFDPYPFIFLNLILSCLAAIQAPIIMMSQNRQEEKDRRRARGDYMINMKAEMEVRSLHGKMDLLLTEQMQSLFKAQEAQLDLLVKIDRIVNELKLKVGP